jgi:hypothetical protein
VTVSIRTERRDHRGRDLRLVLRNEEPGLASAVIAEAAEGPRVPQVFGLYDRLPLDLQLCQRGEVHRFHGDGRQANVGAGGRLEGCSG